MSPTVATLRFTGFGAISGLTCLVGCGDADTGGDKFYNSQSQTLGINAKKQQPTCDLNWNGNVWVDIGDCKSGAIQILSHPNQRNDQLSTKVTVDPKDCFTEVAFEFRYGGNPSGWTVNIGDSECNNGYGGDCSRQSNDAEFFVLDDSAFVYANDLNPGPFFEQYSVIKPGSTNTVTVLNQKIKMAFAGMSPLSLRSRDELFALNGQADSEGPVNYDIYASFNQVIDGGGRTGTGVDAVRIILGGWKSDCTPR
jgi:hypothetical protein